MARAPASNGSSDGAPPADVIDTSRRLIALEGRLAQSALGPAIDLSSITALAANVSVGGKTQYVVIPVRGGRFTLEYLDREDGSMTLMSGSKPLAPLPLVLLPPGDPSAATVTVIAPTLTSAGAVRFLDPGSRTSPPRRRVTIPFGSRALVLTVEAPPQVRLRVTDAASGAGLDGVSVHLTSSTISPAPVIARGLAFGELIPRPGGDEEATQATDLEIRVDGYSPGRATANFVDGDDVSVAVERCGALFVEVLGGPLSDGEVSLHAGGHGAAHQVLESRPLNRLRRLEFNAVPPGPVIVELSGVHRTQAQRGTRARDKGLCDLQEVLVESGQTTSVQLRAAPHALGRAPAAGRVLVPEAWEALAQFTVTLAPGQNQAPEPISCNAALSEERLAGYRVYDFDAGEVPVGRYRMSSKNPGLEAYAMVPPEGATEIELRAEPPVLFKVRLVNRTTGAVAPYTQLAVGTMPPFPGPPENPRVVSRPAGAKEFTFQAPYRTMSIMVLGLDSDLQYSQMIRQDGDQTTTIELP